jgi:bacillolysin
MEARPSMLIPGHQLTIRSWARVLLLVPLGLVLASGPTAVSADTFVRTNDRQPIASGESRTAPAERRARSFLRRHGRVLGVRDTTELVEIDSTGPDAVGLERVRLQQMHRGIPVRGAELSVHLREENVVTAHGRTAKDLEGLPVVPAIDEAAAHEIAQTRMTRSYDAADALLSTPRLEIFNQGLFDGTRTASRLAWYIEGSRYGLRVSIWVDALSGDVLLDFNALADALNRMIYDSMSTSNIPGTLVRSEGEAPLGDPVADSVYAYTGDTYDYFLGEHGRDSYDGVGSPMRASVGYCVSAPSGSCAIACPCSNAFWYGTFMVAGSGFATDDVVGHEFTHGVTAHSAGLVYLNQSGALNESFSDVFGESIDLTNGAGDDSPAARWRIGEDFVGPGIRNMADPHLGFGGPDPGKLTDPELVCSAEDNGGVHTNSGIANHAYALMVDGGTYNGHAVDGIGLSKAGKIAYRSLTSYLTATSSFQDHYQAVQQSCGDLVGTAGIGAADCGEVRKALDAVEMGLPWPCNCGNGALDEGEECDDGNSQPLDGCEPTCLFLAPDLIPATAPFGRVILTACLVLAALGWARRRATR